MPRIATALALFLMGCASTASQNAGGDEVRAACQAQAFLERNGYLSRLENPDPSSITLELWDRMQYEKDGSVDWDRLFADREGQFLGKLYGVGERSESFLVFYRIEGNYSCVAVTKDFAEVSLSEANCRANPPITRLAEPDLHCP